MAMRWVFLIALGSLLFAPASEARAQVVERDICYYCALGNDQKEHCSLTPTTTVGRTLCSEGWFYRSDGTRFWSCNTQGLLCSRPKPECNIGPGPIINVFLSPAQIPTVTPNGRARENWNPVRLSPVLEARSGESLLGTRSDA